MDLADLGTRRLSWRRLRNIIKRLPATSSYWSEVNGPGFTVEAQLLDLLLFVTRKVHHGKGREPEPLLPALSPKKLMVASLPAARMREELAKWRNGGMPNFT